MCYGIWERTTHCRRSSARKFQIFSHSRLAFLWKRVSLRYVASGNFGTHAYFLSVHLQCASIQRIAYKRNEIVENFVACSELYANGVWPKTGASNGSRSGSRDRINIFQLIPISNQPLLFEILIASRSRHKQKHNLR